MAWSHIFFKKNPLFVFLTLTFFVLCLYLVHAYYKNNTARFFWNCCRFDVVVEWLNPSDGELYRTMGEYFLSTPSNYNIQRAEFFIKKADHFSPRNSDIEYLMARIYFVRGDYIKADEYLNKSLADNPKNLRPFYLRGLAALYSKEYDLAERYFKTFIAWAPKEWAGYNDLAWTYLLNGQYEAAVTVATDGLTKTGQNNIWLRNNRGLALFLTKRPLEALSDFLFVEQALKQMPLTQWQSAYPSNGPAGAQAAQEEFSGGIYYNLYRVYESLGEKEKKEEALQKAKEKTPLYSANKKVLDGLVNVDN